MKKLSFLLSCLGVLGALTPATLGQSTIVLDIDGSPSDATMTASVIGSDTFTFDSNSGILNLFQPPPEFGIFVQLGGAADSLNPCFVRAREDGSAFDMVQLATGDSGFELSASSPYTSTNRLLAGRIQDLAPLDGTTTLMSVNVGGGTAPDVFVTLNYNVVEPTTTIVLDVIGSPLDPAINVSVIGNDVFDFDPVTGSLELEFDFPAGGPGGGVEASIEGPLGDESPIEIRGNTIANELSFVRLSVGAPGAYELSQLTQLQSSSIVVDGPIADLAYLDGASNSMNVVLGSGTAASVNVTLNYLIFDTVLVLDVEGLVTHATVEARVVGDGWFGSDMSGALTLESMPVISEVDVALEGPFGDDPWQIQGFADGSEISRVRLTTGNQTSFFLDFFTSITSSCRIANDSSAADLAVLDNTTSLMTIVDGNGSSSLAFVTVNYEGVDSDTTIVLDVNGTEDDATIRASVVGPGTFETNVSGAFSLNGPFFGFPDFQVQLDGALGNTSSFQVSGPNDGSYLPFVRIASGDSSVLALDESNSITSSSNVVVGSITDLAALDGTTTIMSTTSCPEGACLTNVTLNYNIIEGSSDHCSGDGGDQAGCSDCPCGNDATPGTVGGCLNSAGTSTRLLASGSRSISAADLRFEAVGVPPANSAVLTSGNSLAPANPASPCFGLDSGIQALQLDGLRCVVQGVQRHGVRASDANGEIGMTTNGWGMPSAFFGFDTFAAGTTKHFQIIHRDDAGAVCMRGQNSSQAVSLTFLP